MAISKKCLRCNSCCKYEFMSGIAFLYCDFCERYYVRETGTMKLILIENTEEYIIKKFKGEI